MPVELDTVVWPTVFGITASIVLGIALVVRKKASRVGRADSVQYVFTATVKARTPGVTYLDFPAPLPPNHDREAIGHGPTILRTFGRTLTRLRFSDMVEAKGDSGSTASGAARQRRGGRAATLQITPLRSASGPPEGSTLRESASPAPDNPREASTLNSVPGPRVARREPTPGPSTSYRALTPASASACPQSMPAPNTLHREATLEPNTRRREPALDSVGIRRDPTPGLGERMATASGVATSPNSDRELSNPCSISGSSVVDDLPRLVRNKRFSGKVGEGADAVRVMMYWWETTSPERILAPPDLSRCQELRLGDLFLHRHDEGIQIWIWIEGRDRDSRLWKKIPVGYVRVDGRILAFTEVNKQPSWLDPEWHSARRRQHRL